MKRAFAFLFVLLLLVSLYRSINYAEPLSFDFVMRVFQGVSVDIQLSQFSAVLSDIGNFFTNFTGQFPTFSADNVFDAIKNVALYVWTFMQMFANFVANIVKFMYLAAVYPIRACWAFISAFFQLIGIPIGNLPNGYGDGWRGGR